MDQVWDDMGRGEALLGMAYSFLNSVSDYVDGGPDDAPRLSRRETQCLAMAAKGLTLDETGEALGIARSTVRYHIDNAIAKLGVQKRVQAISRATSLGMLNSVN